jgi:hypothetical protein
MDGTRAPVARFNAEVPGTATEVNAETGCGSWWDRRWSWYVQHRPDLDVVGREGDVLREVLVHMIEEYARHNGHADLLRERIDGRVGQ